MTTTLQSYLQERAALVDAALDRFLTAPEGSPPELMEAIRYSALAPGKRLRPVLVIAGAEAVGGRAETVLPTACAIELIHAFSLVHDDLPALDNDEMRRGQPTAHVKFGEAMAILAGDAMLTMAFELIGRNVEQAPPDRVVKALNVVARATGADGMVAGQVLDILSEGKPADHERLEYIHLHKTAALIAASTAAGAILCGGADEQVARLHDYGVALGLAFQIADDLLNVTGDEVKLGKAVGSDAGRGKVTFPSLFGLVRSEAMAQQLVQRAVEAAGSFGEAAEPLVELARYSIERRS